MNTEARSVTQLDPIKQATTVLVQHHIAPTCRVFTAFRAGAWIDGDGWNGRE